MAEEEIDNMVGEYILAIAMLIPSTGEVKTFRVDKTEAACHQELNAFKLNQHVGGDKYSSLIIDMDCHQKVKEIKNYD